MIIAKIKQYLPATRRSVQTSRDSVINETKILDEAVINHFKNKFPEIIPFNGGRSGNKKYLAKDAHGNAFFVKLFSSKYNRKMIKKISSYCDKLKLFQDIQNLPVRAPVEFGMSPYGVYTIENWMEGKALNSVLSKGMGAEGEYRLGLKVGKAIKSLHDNNNAPHDFRSPNWKKQFSAIADKDIKRYLSCGVRFDGDEEVIKYINENRHLTANRPMCLIHKDYHPANIMMRSDGEIVIIDFPIDSKPNIFYDPYYEFRKLILCRRWPVFITGYINGYTSSPDRAFWDLLRLYCYTHCLHMVWYRADNPSLLSSNMAHVKSCIDAFKSTPSAWYQQNINSKEPLNP